MTMSLVKPLSNAYSASARQIIMSLDEDSSGQKMQLAYRLQQVAALVENKVTDLWPAAEEEEEEADAGNRSTALRAVFLLCVRACVSVCGDTWAFRRRTQEIPLL